MSDAPPHEPRTTPWSGGAGTPHAWCVLAPNPGPMTLDGTNTWVVHRPGSPSALVVDPGPADPGHLRAVLDAVAGRGSVVGQILLTHGHLDHSEGAGLLARWSGAPVRALDPAYRLGDEGLGEGDVVDVGGVRVDVVATPGHTADSLCFVLREDGAVLTGDTLLGRGTTVVAHPDGRLGDYLASLRRLDALTREGAVRTVLPGHGPVLDGAGAVVRAYLDHRRERLEQVREAVRRGHRSARAVVEDVYADVDDTLWPAAELSVRAQLEYLGLPPQ